MRVRFDRFDAKAYDLFLRTKKLPEQQTDYDMVKGVYTISAPARFAEMIGVKVPRVDRNLLPFPKELFDRQRDTVVTALKAKRYAVWWDCGLGKTLTFLEWLRQATNLTKGRGLILSPKPIIWQTTEECARFYGDSMKLVQLHSRQQLDAFCKGEGEFESHIGICNYEKLISGVCNEMRYLTALVCDESSCLKSGGGVIKWNLIKSAKGIEYKLSCTATPAPNDTMEYASQASFLEKLRTEGEILWTFFKREGKNGQGDWVVKPHAREAFYRFMAAWSIYLRDPSAYGWKDGLEPVPEPKYYEQRIEPTKEQLDISYSLNVKSKGLLFDNARMGIRERSKLSQLAKGFMYADERKTIQRIKSNKPKYVAGIIDEQIKKGRQVLCWTSFAEEERVIRENMTRKLGKEIGTVEGNMTELQREDVIEQFLKGNMSGLISKPSLLGYGMNFQNVEAMVFSGWDDSYERFYQAIRRAYRYGQKKTLHVFIPFIEELEGMILKNVLKKKEQFERDTSECERLYRQACKEVKIA